MAGAIVEQPQELKHAQARFALQRAHAKLQAGDPVGALQVFSGAIARYYIRLLEH